MKKLKFQEVKQLYTNGRLGRHRAGENLYLEVSGPQSAIWVLRYQVDGRRRYMSLGSFPGVSLADAGKRAREARQLVKDGIDPLAQRDVERSKARALAAKPQKVRDLVPEYIASKKDTLAKTTLRSLPGQIRPGLEFFGDDLIVDVNRSRVVQFLRTIWTAKPAAARLLKSHFKQMFDIAVDIHELRPDNPFQVSKKLLGGQPEGRHQPALDYHDIPEFMARLRAFERNSRRLSASQRLKLISQYEKGTPMQLVADRFGVHIQTAYSIARTNRRDTLYDSVAVKRAAVETAVLLALRPGEVRHTQWSEIDWDTKVLVIPRSRMKMKKGRNGEPFIVPLTKRVLDIFGEMKPISDVCNSSYVFPGSMQGRGRKNQEEFSKENPTVRGFPMSQTALLEFVQDDLGYSNAAPHGFRASFAGWADEQGADESDVELSLDHKGGFSRIVNISLGNRSGNKTHRAYHRGKLVERRRALLEAWGEYCDGNWDGVIALRSPGQGGPNE